MRKVRKQHSWRSRRLRTNEQRQSVAQNIQFSAEIQVLETFSLSTCLCPLSPFGGRYLSLSPTSFVLGILAFVAVSESNSFSSLHFPVMVERDYVISYFYANFWSERCI